MTNNFKLNESLSALMDSEIDDLELRRILKELPNNSDLEKKWEHYHLISAVLKQEACIDSSVPINLLAGIRAQLSNESSDFSEQLNLDDAVEETEGQPALFTSTLNNSKPSGLLRTFAQGAIAATVAIGVLYSANLVFEPTVVSPLVAENPVTEPVVFDVNSLPEFKGDFNASELMRVVNYDGLNDSDEAARNRIRQSVYQAFEQNALTLGPVLNKNLELAE